ncbi:hypothetical protein XH98_30140 [Bradyrhizobium sp. CCBAU 51745]|nr:hypothetical protein [Bradyrhizobium sp. CCBAU 51745]
MACATLQTAADVVVTNKTIQTWPGMRQSLLGWWPQRLAPENRTLAFTERRGSVGQISFTVER